MAKFLDTSGLTYLWGKITTALATKQNTLTPGSNITISNDTISATDTNRPIAIYTDYGATTLLQNNDKRELRLYAIESADNIILHKMHDLDERVVLRITAKDTKPHDLTVDSTPAAINVDSSTSWKIITSFTGLDRDALYLISVALQWQSNATGFRSIGISNSVSSADPIGIVFQNTVAAVNGAATNMTMTTFLTPTNGELSLVGRQNSGSSKTCSYRYRFIKLT